MDVVVDYLNLNSVLKNTLVVLWEYITLLSITIYYACVDY